jgi:hypothetical protein
MSNGPKIIRYVILPDIKSRLYVNCERFLDACVDVESNLKKVKPNNLYMNVCFEQIVDKLSKVPGSHVEKYDNRMDNYFVISMSNENLNIRVFGNSSYKGDSDPALVLDYITTSIFRKMFMPKYFRDVTEKFNAKTVSNKKHI